MKRRPRAGDQQRQCGVSSFKRLMPSAKQTSAMLDTHFVTGQRQKASSSTQPIHETRQEQLIFCNKTVCLSDVRRALR